MMGHHSFAVAAMAAFFGLLLAESGNTMVDVNTFQTASQIGIAMPESAWIDAAQTIINGARRICTHNAVNIGFSYRACQQAAEVLSNHIFDINQFQTLYSQFIAASSGSVNYNLMITLSRELASATFSLAQLQSGAASIAG